MKKIIGALFAVIVASSCASGGGPKPTPTPIPTITMVPDTDSKLPDRRRPSNPPSVCDADDTGRAQSYSMATGPWKGDGYGYLANRCDLVHEWKLHGNEVPNGGDIVNWLCTMGYDSPLSVQSQHLTFDRKIVVGDKVAIWLRDDGKMQWVKRIPDWNSIPEWATNGAPHGISGTVIAIGTDAWLLSSYGQPATVNFDSKSSVLDLEGYSYLGDANYHGEVVESAIDPKAPVVDVIVPDVPCWRDEPKWTFYNKVTKCLNAGTGQVTTGPCEAAAATAAAKTLALATQAAEAAKAKAHKRLRKD